MLWVTYKMGGGEWRSDVNDYIDYDILMGTVIVEQLLRSLMKRNPNLQEGDALMNHGPVYTSVVFLRTVSTASQDISTV